MGWTLLSRTEYDSLKDLTSKNCCLVVIKDMKKLEIGMYPNAF